MFILRVIVFAVVAISLLVVLIKNTKKWALAWQQYFIRQSKKMFFGDAGAWEGTSGQIISTIAVIFFGFMVIVLAYVLCFGGLG
jgi:hypothetical protein